MNNKYYVCIIDSETEECIKKMGPMPRRKAERVEDGANINLDHERYYTAIEEQEDEDDE